MALMIGLSSGQSRACICDFSISDLVVAPLNYVTTRHVCSSITDTSHTKLDSMTDEQAAELTSRPCTVSNLVCR